MTSSQAHPHTDQHQPPVCKRSPESSLLPSQKLLGSVPRNPFHLHFIKITLLYYNLLRRQELQQGNK